MGQDGVKCVDIKNKDFITELIVDYDKVVTAFIIYKYIKLFNDSDVSSLISFDKNDDYDINILKYNVEDMCCENCYKGLVEELFLNDKIKSVKSNFDFNNMHNVELIIEYNKDYEGKNWLNILKIM